MYTQTQLAALKAYLDANAADFGALDDQAAAELMNNDVAPEGVVRVRASMSGSEVAANIDATEYGALTSADKSVILALCAIDTLNPADGGLAHQTIASIFGAGTTANNLLAARSERVSRAVSINLPRCRADYVRVARLLP